MSPFHRWYSEKLSHKARQGVRQELTRSKRLQCSAPSMVPPRNRGLGGSDECPCVSVHTSATSELEFVCLRVAQPIRVFVS